MAIAPRRPTARRLARASNSEQNAPFPLRPIVARCAPASSPRSFPHEPLLGAGTSALLFSYAPPAERPAAQPSASFFDRMQGADHLPDRETHDVGCTLTFDKALYNWIIELCRADSLGVRSDEVASCSRLLKAVRDALQAIDGREGAFRYARVPARWKEYTKLTGDQAIKRAKRPAKSLQWTRVQPVSYTHLTLPTILRV